MTTFCNPLAVKLAVREPGYLADLERFDHVYADGVLLARAAAHLRNRPVPRLSFDGNSLGASVLALASARALPVAVVGGRDGVAATAAARLAEQGVPIAFAGPGHFSSGSERQASIQAVVRSGAAIVVAGMGAPHQERYLLELRGAGQRGAAFTCGGYLDQIVRRGIRYYPGLVDRLHLRFLRRVLDEPVKMTVRYTIDYAPFYACVARRRLARSAEGVAKRAGSCP